MRVFTSIDMMWFNLLLSAVPNWTSEISYDVVTSRLWLKVKMFCSISYPLSIRLGSVLFMLFCLKCGHYKCSVSRYRPVPISSLLRWQLFVVVTDCLRIYEK